MPKKHRANRTDPQSPKVRSVDSLFGALSRYIQMISFSFLVIETIIAILFGALLGLTITDLSLWPATASTGLLYILLLAVKSWSQTHFPNSLVGELHARSRLDDTERQLSNRSTLFQYIADSISALNAQTCAISDEDNDSMCSQTVREGLLSLIKPIIHNPQHIFTCNETMFTVACFVEYHDYNPPQWKEDVVVLRDDLDVGEHLIQDILENNRYTGGLFELQKLLQKCKNENSFRSNTFTIGEQSLTAHASPIPLICENATESSGILLFIANSGHSCPENVDDTLKIFGRIVANWLAKYSDCAIQRHIREYQQRLTIDRDASHASPENTGEEEGI